MLISHNASVGKVVRAPVNAGDFLIGTSATYYRCNSEAVDPGFLVHNRKEAAESSDRFRSSQHQEPAGIQRIVEHRDDSFLEDVSQVDQNITAADEIHS